MKTKRVMLGRVAAVAKPIANPPAMTIPITDKETMVIASQWRVVPVVSPASPLAIQPHLLGLPTAEDDSA
ncbi:MAG: hypothetical protein ACRDNP_01735 [Gaiellaceae bacterium]